MDLSHLAQLAQSGLWLSVVLSLPIVGVAAIVSLFMALFQAATQVQDITIAHLPRFIGVAVAIAVSGTWMANSLIEYAAQIFTLP